MCVPVTEIIDKTTNPSLQVSGKEASWKLAASTHKGPSSGPTKGLAV